MLWLSWNIPTDLPLRGVAHHEVVAFHETCLKVRCAGATIFVTNAMNAMNTITIAWIVFVGSSEDVTRFVCKNPVDVYGAPSIVEVVHHHSFADRISEMRELVFCKECHVSPIGLHVVTELFDVLQRSSGRRRESYDT